MKFYYFMLALLVFTSCDEESQDIVATEINTSAAANEIKVSEELMIKDLDTTFSGDVSGYYVDSYFWELVREKLATGKTLSEAMELGYFSDEGITQVLIYLEGTENDFQYDIGTMESDMVYGKDGKFFGESVKDEFTYYFENNKFMVDGGRGGFLEYESFDTDIFDSLFYTKYAGIYSLVDSVGTKMLNLKYNGEVEGWSFSHFGLHNKGFEDFYYNMEHSDPIYFTESDSIKFVYDAVLKQDKIEFWNKRKVYDWETDSWVKKLSDTLDFTLIREKG